VGIVQEPRTVWKKANLALKQAIQRIVFPKPLIYAQKEKKFRNVECAGVYRFFEEITPQKAGLVVWKVLREPVFHTNPCLTGKQQGIQRFLGNRAMPVQLGMPANKALLRHMGCKFPQI